MNVYLYDANYNFLFAESLNPDETTWEPFNAAPFGTNHFEVNYVLTDPSEISFSTPVNDLLEPLVDWEGHSQLLSYSAHQFVVTSSGDSFGHTLQAHYNFDNAFDRGEDISGNEYHIRGSGNYDGGSVVYNDQSVAGDGAAFFDNNGGTGGAYLAPPTNIFPTLSGSFTVSVWVKTSSETFGDDDDPGWLGAGIVFPHQLGAENNSVPISITGSKAAFYTDHSSAVPNTLHSSVSVNTDEYVHIAVTRKQSTGEKKIYINGALDSSSIGTTATLNSIDEMFDLEIGNGEKGYHGLLDDLQIYSDALSDKEIAFLFDNPGRSVPSLPEAVDATDLVWTTGGNANWFGQITETQDGNDAAQSGDINDDEDSWIETTVTGPGTASFWWKVSSDDFNSIDYLQLEINQQYQTEISGEFGDWEFLTFDVGSGDHVFRWTYSKDSEFSSGLDAGFLDEFSFTPGEPLEIITQPFDQNNSPGYKVALFAEATGTPAPEWQWYKVGVGAIPDATSALYIPADSGTASVTGEYYAEATNDSGTEQTDIATVTFVDAPLPPDWTQAFKAPSDNNEMPVQEAYLACSLDSSGNLYSAGSFSGTNTFGSQTFISANEKFETIVVKQSATGSLIWALSISSTNGEGNSFPQGMAPAPGDGIYVSGSFSGTNMLGTNQLVSPQGSSIYLTRIDSSGNVVWVRTAGGTNSNFTSFHQIVSEPSGNVTISALMNGAVNFGTTNIILDGQRGVLAQYDASGNLRWLQQPSGWFMNLTYDSGQIYGAMGGGETNYVGGITNISDRRWVLAALNPENGQAYWLRPFSSERTQSNPSGLGDDTPTIAVSGTNVFVVGSGWGSSATFGPFTVFWSQPKGQYFARFDTNGTAQLATAFGSPTTTAYSTVADALGNVYVGGDFDTYSLFGDNLLAAPPLENIGAGTFSHGFVAKFDRNGNALWARLAEAQSRLVNVRDIKLTADGIWACGFIDSPTEFGSITVASALTCIGTPFCSLTFHRSGVLAKITDAGATALPTTILNPTRVDNNVTFQFLSQSGFTHFVESRTNVASGAWIERTNLVGDGFNQNHSASGYQLVC